jgi:hypothetical protein
MRFLLLFTVIHMQMIKVLKVVSLRTRKLERMHLQILAMQCRDQLRQARALGRDKVTLRTGVGGSYSALQASVTGGHVKAFGSGPAQLGHALFIFCL